MAFIDLFDIIALIIKFRGCNMTTIKADIPKELNDSLFAVAKFENQSVSNIISDTVRRALEARIREYEEDKKDADIALARMKNPNRKFYTSEEMRERLESRCRIGNV